MDLFHAQTAAPDKKRAREARFDAPSLDFGRLAAMWTQQADVVELFDKRRTVEEGVACSDEKR